MDTSLLKTFLLLAKTRNFTKAAAYLHRSQAAISLQLTRLEEMLGKSLFIRNNRHVILTAQGEQLVGFAKELLHMEEKMIAHFHEATGLIGDVIFGTPEDIATVYLPDILASFVKTHPHILLNVHCELTKNLQIGFENSQYDLVLIKQDPSLPHPDSCPLFNETLVWVAHPLFKAHFEISKQPLPLILAPSPCVYRQKALDALNDHGMNWRVVFSSPSFTGILAAVKGALGIAVMPLNMVPDGLVILEDLPQMASAEMALLIKQNPSLAVKALADYVSNHMIFEDKSLCLTDN